MMTCRAVREQVSALLDGELSADRADPVRRHLAACPDCAAYRDELAATEELLDAIEQVAPSSDFTANGLARVSEGGREAPLTRLRRAMWRPMPRWAAAVAAASAVAIGSTLGWVTGPGAGPEARATERSVIARQFGLEAFDDLPADSIGGAYVQVVWPEGGDGR